MRRARELDLGFGSGGVDLISARPRRPFHIPVVTGKLACFALRQFSVPIVCSSVFGINR